MSAHVITRAEMARRLGVARPTVTKACREGGRLAVACSGRGINVLHPEARRWLAERGAIDAAAVVPPTELPPEAPIPVDGPDAPEGEGDELAGETRAAARVAAVPSGPWLDTPDLADLAEPLTALTERYGSDKEFAGWVRVRKTLEEARKAEMLRLRIEGRLIARTTVVRMIEHVDVAFRLLLTDAPRTIATRLSAPDMPAATAMIRDVMSQMLEAAREHMAASLEADDPMAPLAEAAA